MAALSSRFLISPQCPKLNHYNSVIISFYPSICRFTQRVSELESWFFFQSSFAQSKNVGHKTYKNIFDGSKPQVYTWTWKLLYEIQKLLFHIFVTTTKSSAYPTSFWQFFLIDLVNYLVEIFKMNLFWTCFTYLASLLMFN